MASRVRSSRFFAVSTVWARTVRTQLSASMLYVRSIRSLNWRTRAAPSFSDPFTIQPDLPRTAVRLLIASLICARRPSRRCFEDKTSSSGCRNW